MNDNVLQAHVSAYDTFVAIVPGALGAAGAVVLGFEVFGGGASAGLDYLSGLGAAGLVLALIVSLVAGHVLGTCGDMNLVFVITKRVWDERKGDPSDNAFECAPLLHRPGTCITGPDAILPQDARWTQVRSDHTGRGPHSPRTRQQ